MSYKLAAVIAILIQTTAWGQGNCDRACLENFVDQYMDALIAHEPKKLPMTARVKNTEDGVRLDPGDGFWRTALAKGSYRLFVTDTESGQVTFMGTMREVNAPMPNPVIIAIRLRDREPAGFRNRKYCGPRRALPRRISKSGARPTPFSLRRSPQLRGPRAPNW